MDPLVSLFGTADDVEEMPESLPPEVEEGNVEYKLKLVDPSDYRFEHLVTQMKWRLQEGQGEAVYEIGVEDNGLLHGLSHRDMVASLHTLKRMAHRLGADISVLREKLVESQDSDSEAKRVAEVLVRKVPDNQQFIDLRLAVLGNVDAGKSTLLGVLTQGELDNGRGRARLNLFRHLHEIQSGRTSSISHEILGFNSKGEVVNYSESRTVEEICENSTKLITLIDLCGHHKYLKTTVFGLTGYSPDFAMLLVSANTGIVGTTKEHLGFALALRVPIFVVVSKVDQCRPQQVDRCIRQVERLLKSPGCKKIPFRVENIDDAVTAASSFHSERRCLFGVRRSDSAVEVHFKSSHPSLTHIDPTASSSPPCPTSVTVLPTHPLPNATLVDPPSLTSRHNSRPQLPTSVSSDCNLKWHLDKNLDIGGLQLSCSKSLTNNEHPGDPGTREIECSVSLTETTVEVIASKDCDQLSLLLSSRPEANVQVSKSYDEERPGPSTRVSDPLSHSNHLQNKPKSSDYLRAPAHRPIEDISYPPHICPIFAVSSVSGLNLDLLTTFLNVVPPLQSSKERELCIQQHVEHQIDVVYSVPDVGRVVGGTLLRGTVKEGDQLLVGPTDDGQFLSLSVNSIHRNRLPCRVINAGQAASLGIGHFDNCTIRKGMVLVSPTAEPTCCIEFEAEVYVLFHSHYICKGFQTVVHVGNVCQTAKIIHMNKGYLQTNEKAKVVFRFNNRPEYIRPGSRLIFREGRTKGMGEVTKLIPYESVTR